MTDGILLYHVPSPTLAVSGNQHLVVTITLLSTRVTLLGVTCYRKGIRTHWAAPRPITYQGVCLKKGHARLSLLTVTFLYRFALQHLHHLSLVAIGDIRRHYMPIYVNKAIDLTYSTFA